MNSTHSDFQSQSAVPDIFEEASDNASKQAQINDNAERANEKSNTSKNTNNIHPNERNHHVHFVRDTDISTEQPARNSQVNNISISAVQSASPRKNQIRIKRVVCYDLDHADPLGLSKNDPYVSVTLGAQSFRTDCQVNAGAYAAFDGLEWSLALGAGDFEDSKPLETLVVRVFSRGGVSASDVLIGETSQSVSELLAGKGDDGAEVVLHLLDAKHRPSGRVVLFVQLVHPPLPHVESAAVVDLSSGASTEPSTSQKLVQEYASSAVSDIIRRGSQSQHNSRPASAKEIHSQSATVASAAIAEERGVDAADEHHVKFVEPVIAPHEHNAHFVEGSSDAVLPEVIAPTETMHMFEKFSHSLKAHSSDVMDPIDKEHQHLQHHQHSLGEHHSSKTDDLAAPISVRFRETVIEIKTPHPLETAADNPHVSFIEPVISPHEHNVHFAESSVETSGDAKDIAEPEPIAPTDTMNLFEKFRKERSASHLPVEDSRAAQHGQLRIMRVVCYDLDHADPLGLSKNDPYVSVTLGAQSFRTDCQVNAGAYAAFDGLEWSLTLGAGDSGESKSPETLVVRVFSRGGVSASDVLIGETSHSVSELVVGRVDEAAEVVLHLLDAKHRPSGRVVLFVQLVHPPLPHVESAAAVDLSSGASTEPSTSQKLVQEYASSAVSDIIRRGSQSQHNSRPASAKEIHSQSATAASAAIAEERGVDAADEHHVKFVEPVIAPHEHNAHFVEGSSDAALPELIAPTETMHMFEKFSHSLKAHSSDVMDPIDKEHQHLQHHQHSLGEHHSSKTDDLAAPISVRFRETVIEIKTPHPLETAADNPHVSFIEPVISPHEHNAHFAESSVETSGDAKDVAEPEPIAPTDTMNLFEKFRKERSASHLPVEDRRAAQHGQLRIKRVVCYDLDHADPLGLSKNDPYVSVTLGAQSFRTDCQVNAGAYAAFDGLEWSLALGAGDSGESKSSETLVVRVFSRGGVSASDVLIGETSQSVSELVVGRGDEAAEVVLHLLDAKHRPSGRVVLFVQLVQPLSASTEPSTSQQLVQEYASSAVSDIIRRGSQSQHNSRPASAKEIHSQSATAASAAIAEERGVDAADEHHVKFVEPVIAPHEHNAHFVEGSSDAVLPEVIAPTETMHMFEKFSHSLKAHSNDVMDPIDKENQHHQHHHQQHLMGDHNAHVSFIEPVISPHEHKAHFAESVETSGDARDVAEPEPIAPTDTMNLFEKFRKERSASRLPVEDSRAAQHGQLRIKRVVCYDLDHADPLGLSKNDPYVSVTLGAQSFRTDCQVNAGAYAAFDGLEWSLTLGAGDSGESKSPGMLVVRVFSRGGMSASDVLIGETSQSVSELLAGKGDDAAEVVLHLLDAKHRPSGRVVLFVQLVQPLSASTEPSTSQKLVQEYASSAVSDIIRRGSQSQHNSRPASAKEIHSQSATAASAAIAEERGVDAADEHHVKFVEPVIAPHEHNAHFVEGSSDAVLPEVIAPTETMHMFEKFSHSLKAHSSDVMDPIDKEHQQHHQHHHQQHLMGDHNQHVSFIEPVISPHEHNAHFAESVETSVDARDIAEPEPIAPTDTMNLFEKFRKEHSASHLPVENDNLSHDQLLHETVDAPQQSVAEQKSSFRADFHSEIKDLVTEPEKRDDLAAPISVRFRETVIEIKTPHPLETAADNPHVSFIEPVISPHEHNAHFAESSVETSGDAKDVAEPEPIAPTDTMNLFEKFRKERSASHLPVAESVDNDDKTAVESSGPENTDKSPPSSPAERSLIPVVHHTPESTSPKTSGATEVRMTDEQVVYLKSLDTAEKRKEYFYRVAAALKEQEEMEVDREVHNKKKRDQIQKNLAAIAKLDARIADVRERREQHAREQEEFARQKADLLARLARNADLRQDLLKSQKQLLQR